MAGCTESQWKVFFLPWFLVRKSRAPAGSRGCSCPNTLSSQLCMSAAPTLGVLTAALWLSQARVTAGKAAAAWEPLRKPSLAALPGAQAPLASRERSNMFLALPSKYRIHSSKI